VTDTVSTSEIGSAATAWAALVYSSGEPISRASSSSEPPQRTRVTVAGSPPVTDTQLAAIGWSSLAATWARISLPRSEPGAVMAVAPRDSAISTSVCAQAAGA
jgi:hypothetical protein